MTRLKTAMPTETALFFKHCGRYTPGSSTSTTTSFKSIRLFLRSEQNTVLRIIAKNTNPVGGASAEIRHEHGFRIPARSENRSQISIGYRDANVQPSHSCIRRKTNTRVPVMFYLFVCSFFRPLSCTEHTVASVPDDVAVVSRSACSVVHSVCRNAHDGEPEENIRIRMHKYLCLRYTYVMEGRKCRLSHAPRGGGGRPCVIYHNIIHVSCGNHAGVMVVRTADDRGSAVCVLILSISM